MVEKKPEPELRSLRLAQLLWRESEIKTYKLNPIRLHLQIVECFQTHDVQ
jgi:hypothetical protein